ncbi:hypothetical protein KEM56_005738 [Ascosphaera pollenicola]|nr:hypothetical protein KEM56_005738 [Ascosphaera pollenicola]
MSNKRSYNLCSEEGNVLVGPGRKKLAHKRVGATQCGKVANQHNPKRLFPDLSRPEEPERWISARELTIYRSLPPHPRVPKVRKNNPKIGGFSTQSFSHGDLRTYLTSKRSACTSSLRSKWCAQAAEAVALLHQYDIIHGDILPAHFLLDDVLDLKIASFHSATMYGEASAISIIQPRYRHPWASFGMTMQEVDIFALGGVMYLIQTGKDPFHNVDPDEIELLYERGVFPDVGIVNAGTIIMKCWRDEVSAADVLEYFKKPNNAANGCAVNLEAIEEEEERGDEVKDVGHGSQNYTSEEGPDSEEAFTVQEHDSFFICEEDCCLKVLDEDQTATTN